MAAKSGKPGPDPTGENRGKRVSVHLNPDELDAVLDRFNLRGKNSVAAGREIGAIMRRALKDKPLLDPAREKAADKGSPVVAKPAHRQAQIALEKLGGLLTQYERTSKAGTASMMPKKREQLEAQFKNDQARIKAARMGIRLLLDHLAATIRKPVDDRPEDHRKAWKAIDDATRQINKAQAEFNKAGRNRPGNLKLDAITGRLSRVAELEALI